MAFAADLQDRGVHCDPIADLEERLLLVGRYIHMEQLSVNAVHTGPGKRRYARARAPP